MKMKVKPTSGEWRQNGKYFCLGYLPLGVCNETEVKGEAEANAAFIVTACNEYETLKANQDKLIEAVKGFLDLKYIGNFKAGELDYPDDFLALRMDAQILLNTIQKEL